jgi:mono/diheme cytochrome c family protein
MHGSSSGRRGGAARRLLVVGSLLVGGLAAAVGGYLAWGALRRAPDSAPDKTARQPGTVAETPLARGERLYSESCLACHGERGRGDGPAAKFLHPKPRDFGEVRFRLVSAVNLLPSDDDLLFVLNRGIPGSAMFPFAHLAEADRQALVGHVRRLTRQALEDRLRAEAAAAGEEVDAADLDQRLERATQPRDAVEVPADWPPPSAESVARGQAKYLKLCAPCHGTSGKGDGVQEQKDDKGLPTRPRDFTRGIFKSGRDPRRLYTRIRLGMPGSPMPGLGPEIPAGDIVDMIHFVLSLSDPTLQARAEHKRTLLTARRIAGPLGDAIAQEQWPAATPLAVTPLWWRDYEEPDLAVAAVHDGKELAIRLSWRDRTRNLTAVRPQDFEDMAAVQLFRGTPEPFLAMGSAGRPVDVWLWNPGLEARAAEYADVDTLYPNMAVDLYPFERPGAGPRPHGPQGQPEDFLTARKAGNLRSDPSRDFTASNLHAQGFGSATMRPRAAQLVRAHGSYTGKEGGPDGRWTVVFRRPLEVPEGAGIRLAAGDRLSAAFALWDGAARDRNGQKLVSIWHDLQLEP